MHLRLLGLFFINLIILSPLYARVLFANHSGCKYSVLSSKVYAENFSWRYMCVYIATAVDFSIQVQMNQWKIMWLPVWIKCDLLQGGRNFFGDVLVEGEGENKKPFGQGGHILHQVFCGVRCVPLVFAFIKSQSYWGAKPPDFPYPKWYCQQYQIFK